MPDPRTQLAAAVADRYDIQREIGAGGSAWVYLARDLRHGRDVAIKVLRPALAEALGIQRFLNEIRITAGLQHPHILTLLDSGEADGLLFYVLPYVEGESLRDRLDREGQLEVAEALRLIEQVASALASAHRRGVLHRDIKPGNILLQEGDAMLADFGIALATDHDRTRITEVGTWLGTPEYMSLEQATAERALDERSDLYSLAAVLYEMLAGEPPYTAPTPHALIAKRMVDPVPRIRRVRPAVPVAVEAALLKALARDAADRHPSVTAFVEALRAPEPSVRQQETVAVLPFRTVGGDADNDVFADGITEDVIAHLAKLQGLRVISRASVMRFRDRSVGLAAIAAELDATTVLDGSVRRSGDRVRIVTQLVDPVTGRGLWSETYDRQLTDIFAIQSEVAVSIATTLRTTLSPAEHGRLQREPTKDLTAYSYYVTGRHLLIEFSNETMRRAIESFEKAVARDPDYAEAHAGIAYAWLELGETGAEPPEIAYGHARSAAERALERDPELAAAHCFLGYLRVVTAFDWAGAEAGLRRAIELQPGFADAYDLYGRLCGAMRRFDEAIANSERAQLLDPLAHRNDLATQYMRAGRDEEALAVIKRWADTEFGGPRTFATLGWALWRLGRREEGLAELDRAARASGNHPQWLAQHGQMLALSGEAARARAIPEGLRARSATEFVSPYHLAYLHTGLGERDEAIALLSDVIDQRSGSAYGIDGSFLFASLRDHPGYAELRRKLKLG